MPKWKLDMQSHVANEISSHLSTHCSTVGFADGLVEMLKDVVEGISSGDVYVTGLESQSMLDRSDRNSRAFGCGRRDRLRGRIA